MCVERERQASNKQHLWVFVALIVLLNEICSLGNSPKIIFNSTDYSPIAEKPVRSKF